MLRAQFLIYCTIVGGLHAIEAYRTARACDRSELQLRASLSEAGLAAQRWQIELHSLFNALNTVAMLVR